MKKQKQQQKKQVTSPAQNLRPQVRQIGAAVSTSFKGGMSDIKGHTLAWQAGSVYVGNGTFGTTDAVYFIDNATLGIVVPVVPVAFADAFVGKTYVSDIAKHFARVRIRRCRIMVVSLHPATTNDMVAYIAPIRGAANLVEAARSVTPSTPTAQTVGNVGAMDDRLEVSSYGSTMADWTKYIAGGSGAQQNEFQISDAVASTSIIGSSGVGIVPLCFAVAGNNSTAALRATTTHTIWIELTLDFLDFVGGLTQSYPIGFYKKESESFRKVESGTVTVQKPGAMSQEDLGQFLRIVRKYSITGNMDSPLHMAVMSDEDVGQWVRLVKLYDLK